MHLPGISLLLQSITQFDRTLAEDKVQKASYDWIEVTLPNAAGITSAALGSAASNSAYWPPFRSRGKPENTSWPCSAHKIPKDSLPYFLLYWYGNFRIDIPSLKLE